MLNIHNMENIIFNEDCRTGLCRLPDNSIDCCVTSPPYYGLRDYGTARWEGGSPACGHFIMGDGHAAGLKQNTNRGSLRTARDICPACGAARIDSQIGLEDTPEMYIAQLVEIFKEVKRVLKPQGTLWLNIGDSYAGSGHGYLSELKGKQATNKGTDFMVNRPPAKVPAGLKSKDLIGIPWMLAFVLRADGWYLRQDIIWHKPNPMPESVRDRCTKSHEYIFLLAKSAKYHFDGKAIQTETRGGEHDKRARIGRKTYPTALINGIRNSGYYPMANKRSVWSVCNHPEKEAHFACFPQMLIADCIKAGCPEGGIVLDPFMGSGTTAVVARKLNRNYVGFELNPDYVKIAETKLQRELGFFA
jgi:DNA modification methylase